MTCKHFEITLLATFIYSGFLNLNPVLGVQIACSTTNKWTSCSGQMKTYKHLFSVPETYKLIITFCCATRVADVCETQLDYILADVDPVLVAFLDDHVETSSVL